MVLAIAICSCIRAVADLADLASLIETKKLEVVIDYVFPFAAVAHPES
jgi:NADPH:quinone reductase-like Zn-dependent oxidoreductase